MLLEVDSRHLQSLAAHLAAQGFPAKRVGLDLLDVLFPASPSAFAAAVELDDWLARIGEAAVRLTSDAAAALPRR
jgi:hypothetical protein